MARSPPGNQADFHAGCDGNTYTISVIKTENGNIFGGVTDVDWVLGGFGTSHNTFLFCIRCAGSPTDVDGNPIPEQMKLWRKPENAVMGQYGPTFGGSHDLHIADKPGEAQATVSFSRLGYTYECPNVLTQTGAECPTYLDGAQTFMVADYEVYALK